MNDMLHVGWTFCLRCVAEMEGNSLDEQVKNVYANFGLAIYHAQCLEHALVNALVFVDLIPSRKREVAAPSNWAERVDAFMGSRFDLTLGQMIRTLSSVTSVDALLHEQLTQALAKRNWLAHNFFRERAEAFLTVAGRRLMIDELEEAQVVFCNADQALEAAVRPARQAAGLTDEMLSESYAKLRIEVMRGTAGE